MTELQKPKIDFLYVVEQLDKCYKRKYPEATPDGLFGHVTDELYELEQAILGNHRVSILEEAWDLIFMTYGLMRSLATEEEVIRMLKMVIEKLTRRIKEGDKT